MSKDRQRRGADGALVGAGERGCVMSPNTPTQVACGRPQSMNTSMYTYLVCLGGEEEEGRREINGRGQEGDGEEGWAGYKGREGKR